MNLPAIFIAWCAHGDRVEPRVQKKDQHGGEHEGWGEKVWQRCHERVCQVTKVSSSLFCCLFVGLLHLSHYFSNSS